MGDSAGRRLLGRERRRAARRIFWLGMLAGVAIGSKVFGVVAAGSAFSVLLALRREFRPLLYFSGSALLFGSGWYLRSYLISGDPISPAGGPWFGYFLWNAADLAGQSSEQARHGEPKNPLYFLSAFSTVGAARLIPGLLAPLFARENRRAIWALWACFVELRPVLVLPFSGGSLSRAGVRRRHISRRSVPLRVGAFPARRLCQMASEWTSVAQSRVWLLARDQGVASGLASR